MSALKNLPIDTTGYRVVFFPLTCCYASLGLACQRDMGGVFNRYWALRRGYDNFTNGQGAKVAPPLGNHDLILPGSEQFTFFTRHSLYPYYWADLALSGKSQIHEILDDNIVGEIFVGDGQKTKEELSTAQFKIRHLVLADMFSNNTTKASQLLSGHPKTKLSGDVLTENFWERLNKILIRLRKEHPNRKVILLMQGATLNDFTVEERRVILNYVHGKHGIGVIDEILVAFDNTTNPHVLKIFYADPGLSHVFLTGLEWHFNSSEGQEKLKSRTSKIAFKAENICGGAEVTAEKDRSIINFIFRDDIQKILYFCENQIEKPRQGGIYDLLQQCRDAHIKICQRIPIDDETLHSKHIRNPESMALIKDTYAFLHLSNR